MFCIIVLASMLDVLYYNSNSSVNFVLPLIIVLESKYFFPYVLHCSACVKAFYLWHYSACNYGFCIADNTLWDFVL